MKNTEPITLDHAVEQAANTKKKPPKRGIRKPMTFSMNDNAIEPAKENSPAVPLRENPSRRTHRVSTFIHEKHGLLLMRLMADPKMQILTKGRTPKIALTLELSLEALQREMEKA